MSTISPPMASANSTPESHLLAIVVAATTSDLATKSTPDTRAILVDLCLDLTKEQAFAAPKIFQLIHQSSKRIVVNQLVCLLCAFVDSVKVKARPEAGDLILMAHTLVRRYSHDSIEDIILALHEARISGYKFYQMLDVSTLYELINSYFDSKSRFLENSHLDQKATGTSIQANDVKLLGGIAQQMLETMTLQIPGDHPNAEGLRRKLTITNARARRGLITSEQAAEQRAEIRRAIPRKARLDWTARPDAQQRIDQRHRVENEQLMKKYRS